MSEWRVKTCNINEPKRSVWRYDWKAGKWRVKCAAVPRVKPKRLPVDIDRLRATEVMDRIMRRSAPPAAQSQYDSAALLNAAASRAQAQGGCGLGTLGGILGLPSFPH